MQNKQDKRLIAAARTLLFNFGQGMWSPVDVYWDCCHLLGCEPKLTATPDYKLRLPGISFFSKKFLYKETMVLFDKDSNSNAEVKQFQSLPYVTKLNWLYNFTYAQVLLFSFSEVELQQIQHILFSWERPAYDYLTIPYGRIVPTNRSTVDMPGSAADIYEI